MQVTHCCQESEIKGLGWAGNVAWIAGETACEAVSCKTVKYVEENIVRLLGEWNCLDNVQL
jgi:hypothetical protein